MLAVAVVLLAAFLAIESRVASPLMPLRLFKRRNVAVSNVVGVLWAAAMFAWFFLSALYMQLVLGYSPAGRSGLPALQHHHGNFLARPVGQAGHALRLQRAAGGGPVAGRLGLALFAWAPVDGQILTDVLPGMLLLGLGAGIAFNPMLLAAMSDVEPRSRVSPRASSTPRS
jgi:TRAP-type mannitol/chloroaromatic compound transport system permease large subunit